MALSLVLVMLQMFLAALDGSAVRIGHAGPVRILGILSQSLFFQTIITSLRCCKDLCVDQDY